MECLPSFHRSIDAVCCAVLCCAVPAYPAYPAQPDQTATHSTACPPPQQHMRPLRLCYSPAVHLITYYLLCPSLPNWYMPNPPIHHLCLVFFCSFPLLHLSFWPSAGQGSQPCPRVFTCLCSPFMYLRTYIHTYLLTHTQHTCACLQAQVHTHQLPHMVFCPLGTLPIIVASNHSTSLSSAMCYHIAVNLGLIAGNVGNHDFCFGHPSASANLHQTGNFVPPNTHTTQTCLVNLCITRLSLSHASALH